MPPNLETVSRPCSLSRANSRCFSPGDIVQERSRFQNPAFILLDSPLPCRSMSTTVQRIEFVPMSMAASLVVSLGKDLIRTQGLDWAFEI